MADRRARGNTVAEMMVYMALGTLVFTGIYGIFRAGLKYYTTAQKVVELQQQAMMAPYRMARELTESSLGGVTFYPNTASGSSVAKGVVFISARDPANGDIFTINPSTGKPRWKKYICYYEEHTDNYHVLCRKEYADPDIVADAKAEPCSHDTNWFASNTSLAKRILARNLASRDITTPGFEIYSGDPEAGTKELDSPYNPICIQFSIQETSSVDDNALRVTLQVSTRN